MRLRKMTWRMLELWWVRHSNTIPETLVSPELEITMRQWKQRHDPLGMQWEKIDSSILLYIVDSCKLYFMACQTPLTPTIVS